ncbi:MAG: hypothetical protein H8E66_00095, partial [Planctomycetes bacterium]|nr:hypothetical protein [Planctomycetota bacterium]
MTDRSKSKGTRSGNVPKRRKQLVAFSVVLVAALIAVLFIRRPSGPQLDPPEITTDGLSKLAAREIAATYDRALKAPRSAEAWGRLGMVLWAHNSEVPARRCLRYAQALDPREFQWPYLLAVNLSASDPPAAVKHLREAIAIRSDVAVAHVRL